MQISSKKYRVNGAFLSNHVGKVVILMGTVLKTHPSGRSWELKTSDDRVITINMDQPLDGVLTGLVEVHGTASSKNTVKCESYIEVPPNLCEKLDLEAYNDAVNIINTIPNPWT